LFFVSDNAKQYNLKIFPVSISFRKKIGTAASIPKRFLGLILVLFLAACSPPDGDKEAGGRFVPPKSVTVKLPNAVSDPMAHALSLIGLNRSDLKRPLAHEEGYAIIGRVPLIDQVAASPFKLHYWADDMSINIQQNATKGLADLFDLLVTALNGGVRYEKRFRSDSADIDSLEDGYRYLGRKLGETPKSGTLQDLAKIGFRPDISRHLGELLAAMADAALLMQAALASLTREEIDFLISQPEVYFFPHGKRFNFLTAPTHVQTRIFDLTRRIDFVSLFSAARIVSDAVDHFYTQIRGLFDSTNPGNYFEDGKMREGVVAQFQTPIGDIVILGSGSNTYSKTSALLIDLGGNDHYTGPIGVGHLVPGHISLAVDISGDDTYNHQKNQISQGMGSLAVGMLVDLSGDDVYISGDMSQGTGIYGIGILADYEGNDRYRMGLMGQGFGIFGIGLLLDRNGTDEYRAGGMGQGAGSTMGLGSLVDVKGNDKYISDRKQTHGLLKPDNWSHVQGAGLSVRAPDWTRSFSYYGGIGFLSEGDGNDIYYASDGNCMGGSYFMSIGALVDHNGNDRYTPRNRNGLGWAVHLSNGILIDRKGNDYYAGTNVGGVGSDRSIGFLADYAGNDIYGPSEAFIRKKIVEAYKVEKQFPSDQELSQKIQAHMAELSYGASLKPKGLGFLIDYQGNDQYFARLRGKRESLGGVLPPEAPEKWSHAVLLDLQGRDYYHPPSRKNNHYHLSYKHGISYDTEYDVKKKVGKIPIRLTRRNLNETMLSAVTDIRLRREIGHLFDSDLFVRHAALGRLMDRGPEIISPLIRFLATSQDVEVNRDIIQILDTHIIRRQMKRRYKFETLLNADDPFVRQHAARTLGWWQITWALPDLIRAMNERQVGIRAAMVWAIGRIGTKGALIPLMEVFRDDSDLDCRRNAMISLAARKFEPDDVQAEIRRIFNDGLNDPDEIIRTHAAAGLRHFKKNSKRVDHLLDQALKADESVYVKRAIARVLISFKTKAALPVLIDTLRYPSIDTFAYYDHDLAKELAFYCGIDFPDDQRFRYETWKKWWDANGHKVNLAQNLSIMDTITGAFASAHEDKGVPVFEQLMREHPTNIVIKTRYKRFCYEWINYRLLTRKKISGEILKRSLRLQKIIIRLDPEDREAKAHLAYFQKRMVRYKKTAEGG